MPTVVHFEIPADDVNRSRKFYSELFDWEIKEISEIEYWRITTSGSTPVNGGMMKRQHPRQSTTNYIGVSSVNDYAAKAEKLGGKVIVPKTAVPGMGYFIVCLDTENNAFGIWEDDREAI